MCCNDKQKEVYLFKSGFFQKIQFDSILQNPGLDYKLTMLDGKPTIFSEAGINVQQLSISDDMVMSSTFAKNQLSQKRHNFGLVQVPLSFFEECEKWRTAKENCNNSFENFKNVYTHDIKSIL